MGGHIAGDIVQKYGLRRTRKETQTSVIIIKKDRGVFMFELKLVNSYIQPQILKDLEDFRFENGRKFPRSYREFAGKYGYGRVLDLFLIYIPMKNYPDSIFVQSRAIKNTYQDILDNKTQCWFDLGEHITLETLNNLYPFAKSENGDYLFWDIESGADEMDIYLSNFRGIDFVPVAKSLDEFFVVATTDTLFHQFPLKFGSPLPKKFQPITVHFD